MGDTGTHGGIAEEIIAILREVRPDEKLDYFELGNWLTDLSQFRDPTAMVGAKASIFGQKTNIITQALAEPVLKFESYLDELMGQPGPQGGLLAAWFREMTLSATIEKFRHLQFDPARIEDLYGSLFTQYYPHEHMDFPPWPRHDIIGERVPSQWNHHDCSKPPTRGSGRKLYQYQEEQLEYISELLTLIEQKWARAPETSNTAPDRQVVLTRFGHASHAIEDFFFHSNFIETAWDQLARPLDFTDHPESGGDDHAHDDHEEPGPRNPTRERRRFFRRLRAPMGSGDDVSTTESGEMREVYTGFFGSKDIFHTFVDAFRGLKAKNAYAGMLVDENAESREDETPEQKAERQKRWDQKHKTAVFDGSYELALRAEVAAGRMHQRSYDAVHRAFEMDRALWAKYPKIDLGISGFFVSLLRLASEEAKVAKGVVAQLDANGVVSDRRSDNGASNEVIGSHSLMAKDSERKHPLRHEAYVIASTVAQYVGKRMAQQLRSVVPATRSVNLPPAQADGGASNALDFRSIDWLHLLQHFVCHPSEAEQAASSPVPWWQPQLDAIDSDELGHRLRFLDDATVQERLKEKKKKELEKKYDDLAVLAEQEWQKVKGTATGTLAGAIIGAVAGAVAGAIIGGMVGGVGGAILGGILGAVAGAFIGGALGALVGYLVS